MGTSSYEPSLTDFVDGKRPGRATKRQTVTNRCTVSDHGIQAETKTTIMLTCGSMSTGDRIADGGWRVASDGWRVAGGGWWRRFADGGWRMANDLSEQ